MTKDDFLQQINSDLNKKELISFVLEQIDSWLEQRNYQIVIDILNTFDFSNTKNQGMPLWLMLYTQPISPLLRPIPPEEEIKELQYTRCKFADKCVEFYKSLETQNLMSLAEANNLASVVVAQKPKDYTKLVNEYDMLFFGGAPKLRQ